MSVRTRDYMINKIAQLVTKRILVYFNVFISLDQLVKISTEKGDIKNMLSLCNEDSISITLALAWPALVKVIHIQVYFMQYNVRSRGRICVHQLRDNPLVIVISTYLYIIPCLTPYNCTKVSLQKLLTLPSSNLSIRIDRLYIRVSKVLAHHKKILTQ